MSKKVVKHPTSVTSNSTLRSYFNQFQHVMVGKIFETTDIAEWLKRLPGYQFVFGKMKIPILK